MKSVLKPIAKMRDSYERTLEAKEDIHPIPLNLALLSNPFLKAEEKYKSFLHELTLYNKRISKGEITDEYEALCFDHLFVMLGEIGNMESRADQVARLAETGKWWVEQRRIIQQRKDLGIVKYKTDKMVDRLREYRTRMAKSMMVPEETPILPN